MSNNLSVTTIPILFINKLSLCKLQFLLTDACLGGSAMGSSANGPKLFIYLLWLFQVCKAFAAIALLLSTLFLGNLAFSTKASERYCILKFDYKLTYKLIHLFH